MKSTFFTNDIPALLLEAREDQVYHLIESNSTIQIQATGAKYRFNLVAYTGSYVSLPGFEHPVVLDLDTLDRASIVQLLYNHNPNAFLGNAEDIRIENYTLLAAGTVNGSCREAIEVRANADQGIKYQLSFGASVAEKNMIFIGAGQSAYVNNHTIYGPAYIARNGKLREISFVPLGADSDTFAYLAASLLGVDNMTFEEWLASLGVDVTALNDESKGTAKVAFDFHNTPAEKQTEQILATKKTPEEKAAALTEHQHLLKASFDSIKTLQQKHPIEKRIPNNGGGGGGGNSDNNDDKGKGGNNNNSSKDIEDPTAHLRASATAELKRQSSIRDLANKYKNPKQGENEILILAMDGGWSPEKTELEMLKASRANVGGGASSHSDDGDFKILEAALMQSVKIPDKFLTAAFSAPVLEQAHKRYHGRLGLQETLHLAARLNGFSGGYSRRLFTDSASHRELLASAFSTSDLPGIMSNTMNKQLLVGYSFVEESWQKLASFGSVSDFKEYTSYRATGSFLAKELAPDGHIEHAEMGEESYTNKIKTMARMYAITRQQQINDDLGVFDQVPRKLGRGQALAIVRAFWKEYMNPSVANFWHAGNNNLSTGALSIDGLSAAEAVFQAFKDPDGEFTGSSARYLVVPPNLLPLALQLYRDTSIATGSTTPVPNSNPHAGKYEPVSSRYLSDTSLTGNSTVQYYLQADPEDVPLIQVDFLNGNRTPTVETAEVDFSQLGIQMRTFWDWGLKAQDPQAGVRSSGA